MVSEWSWDNEITWKEDQYKPNLRGWIAIHYINVIGALYLWNGCELEAN